MKRTKGEVSSTQHTPNQCAFSPASLLPCEGKPQGGSGAIQLPGKLFTDFEAWDPHRLQGRRPETRGPKYCHSSFDAITVGKMVPRVPCFLLPSSSSTSPGVSGAGVQGWGMNYKIQKSQVTSILQGSKPTPSKTLLPAALSPLPQLCLLYPLCCILSRQFGKLGSREAPSLERRQEADGHSSTFSCLWADGQHRLYIFQGNQFWEVTADGNVSEPHPLQKRWAGLPPHIEAAAVSLEDGDFYFFKGTSPGADEKIEA